jgi:phosphohistidine phosphatase SixA
MYRTLTTVIFLLLMSLNLTSAQTNPKIGQALSDGQHVLLMRHAYAPGIGDPPNYQLNNCQTQRNLNTTGKKQARIIGQWLRSNGVIEAKVFASPWCRCLETAQLLNFGPVTMEPVIASFFDNPEKATSQNKLLQRWLQSTLSKRPNNPIILVTHQVNIQEYMGRAIGSGEMVLVQVAPDGSPASYQIIPSPTYE